MKPFTILFFGDVVGKLGRLALQKALPDLKRRFLPDITIANVENLTHGTGIAPKQLRELVDAGVDAFTTGNHVWGNPDGLPLLNDPAWTNRLVRPANMRRADPGRGSTIFTTQTGIRVLLVNLAGQILSPDPAENPFHALDAILESHKPDAPQVTFVDIHAEATAEKEALGHFADGRVSAVMGTHTHVATADAKILPGGTAYCTDVGRVGAYNSVLGFEKNSAIKRFLGAETGSYELLDHGQAEVDGVAIRVNLDTGLATSLDQIREIVDC
jgi:2',3'-cyclic-nucleotide 2'-phosphodiesterase